MEAAEGAMRTAAAEEMGGRYKEALSAIGEAWENGSMEERPEAVELLELEASVHRSQYNLEEEEEKKRRAYEQMKKTMGIEHPRVATSWRHIDRTMERREGEREQERRVAIARRRVELMEKYYGKEHPDVGRAMGELGSVLDKEGKYDEALAVYEEAIKLVMKSLGEGHPNVATSYNNIASVYDSQGKYDEALGMYEKSLDIQRRVLGGEHPDVADSYYNISITYSKQGNHNLANEYRRKYSQHPSTSTKTNRFQ